MNGFIGSMVLLVLSSNLLFLFIGWKLVGLCSYGLIGFYYQDQRKYWIGGPSPNAFVTPSQAGLKALVVTGAGDMLMLGGILVIYVYAETLNFLELYQTASTWIPEMAATPGMLILVSVLLLAGPVGKSAAVPAQRVASRGDGGPRSGVRAHPRRDDGEERSPIWWHAWFLFSTTRTGWLGQKRRPGFFI